MLTAMKTSGPQTPGRTAATAAARRMAPSASVKKKSSVAAAKTMSSGAVPTEEEERVLLRDVKGSTASTKPRGPRLHVGALQDDGLKGAVCKNWAAAQRCIHGDKCGFAHGASRTRPPNELMQPAATMAKSLTHRLPPPLTQPPRSCRRRGARKCATTWARRRAGSVASAALRTLVARCAS